MFRDPIKSNVTFRLRPTLDLRHPRDAFRLRRRLETQKIAALEPLPEGPLSPEVEGPRDPGADDKTSALRDEWRADEREWLEDFRERCRDL